MCSSKAGVARGESGFTLIDMLFVIALIGLVSTLAIPGLMRARGAAQSASALGSIKVVNSAQLSYAITCGLGFYSPDFQTLGVAPPTAVDAFLPPEMSSGATFIKSGYTFSMAGVSVPGAGILQRPRSGHCVGRIRPCGQSSGCDGGRALLRHELRRDHLGVADHSDVDHARERDASRSHAHQIEGSGLGVELRAAS